MKLDAYLKRERLSTAEFAERIGVTAEAVRLYLTGQRIPRPKTVARIAQETGGAVRFRDFFDEMVA
jgi:transcriptional regulator with XRE-family HTH domain